MNCSEAEQLFDAFLDRELTGSLRLEFDAHRLRCRDCQQKLAMLEACEHILSRDGRTPNLSDDFTERLMGEIGAKGLRPRRAIPMQVWLSAAALLPAAALLLFAVSWPTGSSDVMMPAEPAPRVAGIVDEAELRAAMKDPIDLHEFIFEEAGRLRALTRNITDDALSLPSFALHFLPDYISDAVLLNPFEGILDITPSAPEDDDDGGAETTSL